MAEQVDHVFFAKFAASTNVCYGSVAAASLQLSYLAAWGSAYGQKQPFGGLEIQAKRNPPKRVQYRPVSSGQADNLDNRFDLFRKLVLRVGCPSPFVVRLHKPGLSPKT